MDAKEKSRSWFCVLNNPQEIYSGDPHEIAEKVLSEWVEGHPTRTGAVAFCVSADGLPHLHMVLEDSQMARFSAVKKVYPKAHLEPTKGTKEQAEDYISKRGKFREKGEVVVYTAKFGEIAGCQGRRHDFEMLEDFISQGKTPNEILRMSLSYRRYEKIIRDAYYQKRASETPIHRNVLVYWHVGESGSGKSYEMVRLAKEYGEDKLYIVTDYDHGFDKYNGEPIIFMDEFRGQMRYALLLTLLGSYKVQVPCRYTNALALWEEVHITSVLPPERVYSSMVQESRDLDKLDQLMRRIHAVVYHQKTDGEYRKTEVPMAAYKDYETLKRACEVVPDWVQKAGRAGEVEQMPLTL